MSQDSLPQPAQAEHLTTVLRRSGALGPNGHVDAVAVESATPTVLSHIFRLRLSYGGTAVGAPATLILKMGHRERGAATWNSGRKEVAFYAEVAARMRECVVPRCFEANADAVSKSWHLLLEDLSESHAVASRWPLPPTREQCADILGALARFHAAWWDDPRLGDTIGSWSDAAAFERYLLDLAAEFARFADRLGDRLPDARRHLYERLFAAAPRLFARYATRRDITILHGDAHVWNCFLPLRDGGEARLFDWDAWRIDVAADDLAYMMAMHWYPDRRRMLERPLLDHYHATLVEHGVRDYDRRALAEDYRLAVLWLITRPLWQAASNIPPVIWWNNFERVFLAVDDLGCRELLE